jgi:hypothetical protein
MKRIATLTLVVCLFAAAASAASVDGAWTAVADEKRPGSLYFNITRGKSNQTGRTMSVDAFSGLTVAQIGAPAMTPVTFAMRREAGTISFEGTFRGGKGAGQYTFAPDNRYPDAVRALGVAFDLHHRRREQSVEEDLFTLALHDVSTAYIRSMIAEGYKVDLDDYLSMRIFEVTPEYIREMRSLGFSDISHDELIASRIHRVTPQYVRETRAAGWNLTLDELQSSRIHGATPQFAAEMKQLGFAKLSHDDLVSFRIHRVTKEFVESIRALGYRDVDPDDLVSMRIHRVTPEYIREMAAAGYEKVPIEKLVSMRIHGIDAKYVKAMRK